jgi:nucleolar protein 58
VQILGAEKALFKAMRAKQNTPKYGLIYHASLVGQAPAKIKGKISRSLAAKCSLCIRYDALGESNDGVFGATNRQYIEAKMKKLEQSIVEEVPKISTGPAKYQKPRDTTQYNDQSDFQNKAKKKKPE